MKKISKHVCSTTVFKPTGWFNIIMKYLNTDEIRIRLPTNMINRGMMIVSSSDRMTASAVPKLQTNIDVFTVESSCSKAASVGGRGGMSDLCLTILFI